jgi:hypothetical protein
MPFSSATTWVLVPISRTSAGFRSCSSSQAHCASPSNRTEASACGAYFPTLPIFARSSLERESSRNGPRNVRVSSRMICTRLPFGPNSLASWIPGVLRRSEPSGSPKKSRKIRCDSAFKAKSAPPSCVP